MNDFIEFQGKNIDSAIEEACDYFNTEREKLEIEILEDSKSGVFGIIGARKAKIQARKLDLTSVKNDSVFTRSEIIPRENTKPAKAAPKQTPAKQEVTSKEIAKQNPPKKEETPKKDVPKKVEAPAPKVEEVKEEVIASTTNEVRESSFTTFENIDQAKLIAHTKEVIETIVKYVDPEMFADVTIEDERLCVVINSEESGLLIGKEGQTLAALEYLAARIIAKEIDSHVRIQIEVGDYRSRQDQRLKDFALLLAQKVMQSGKPASTKPLSSYQRRIVHLALQEMPEVQTRSIGDGATKRVIVSRAKGERY